jgi:hypothetical protein
MFDLRSTKGKLLLIVLAAWLSSVLTFLAFHYVYESSIYEIREIMMEVYVQKTPGLNVDHDALRFGIVPPGGRGSRNITIENDEVANIVSIEAHGDIAEWVYVSHNDFYIAPGESMPIRVTVDVPGETPVRSYRNGTLRLIFRLA